MEGMTTHGWHRKLSGYLPHPGCDSEFMNLHMCKIQRSVYKKSCIVYDALSMILTYIIKIKI